MTRNGEETERRGGCDSPCYYTIISISISAPAHSQMCVSPSPIGVETKTNLRV